MLTNDDVFEFPSLDIVAAGVHPGQTLTSALIAKVSLKKISSFENKLEKLFIYPKLWIYIYFMFIKKIGKSRPTTKSDGQE